MKKAIALIGAGEVGGVFARGLLKEGYPVFPIIRGMNIKDSLNQVSDAEAVIVGVGEKDLDSVLTEIPKEFSDRLILIQNELLPNSWERFGIDNPTVISVWFEKKPGQDYKVLIPSPIFGSKSELVCRALEKINISVKRVSSSEDLLKELVLKNLYILTTNICGLEVGGTVSELWSQHEEFAREVAADVLDLQFHLIGCELDREELLQGMVLAFEGDPDHKCMGRSAPARLERALRQAEEAGLSVKKLHEINEKKSA